MRAVPTWKRGAESTLKPSEPGCLTRGRARGSSTARSALKLTLPNALACVSGWALSCTAQPADTLINFCPLVPTDSICSQVIFIQSKYISTKDFISTEHNSVGTRLRQGWFDLILCNSIGFRSGSISRALIHSPRSWTCKAERRRRPGSRTPSCRGCIWARSHPPPCTGTLSRCYRWTNLPGSARGPPSHGRKWYHLQ